MNKELISAVVEFLEIGEIVQFGKLDSNAKAFLIDTGHIVEKKEEFEFSQHREVGVNLLKVMYNLRNFFPLFSPYAPGLRAFGGEVELNTAQSKFLDGRQSSISGAGLNSGRSLNACLGEAVEKLATFANEDIVEKYQERDDRPLYTCDATVNENDSLLSGQNCNSFASVLFPAKICVQLDCGPEKLPVSTTGMGAGQTLDQAIVHGLLELIERDSRSMWWIGGRPGRPLELSDFAVRKGNQILAHLRGAVCERRTWLLDISGELDIPCVAAVSANEDGLEVSVGTSCHFDVCLAVEKALTEMCLMELACKMVFLKARENGGTGLNPKDEQHLLRAESLDARDCSLLFPLGVPKESSPSVEQRSVGYEALAIELLSKDIPTFFVELTSPSVGVPVAKCFSPKLQSEPFKHKTSRLESCIEQFGGGEGLHSGMTLS